MKKIWIVFLLLPLVIAAQAQGREQSTAAKNYGSFIVFW